MMRGNSKSKRQAIVAVHTTPWLFSTHVLILHVRYLQRGVGDRLQRRVGTLADREALTYSYGIRDFAVLPILPIERR